MAAFDICGLCQSRSFDEDAFLSCRICGEKVCQQCDEPSARSDDETLTTDCVLCSMGRVSDLRRWEQPIEVEQVAAPGTGERG